MCHYVYTGSVITLNLAGTGTTPSIRDTLGTSTSAVASGSVTLTVVDKNDVAIATAQAAVYVGTTEVFNMDTNGSGVASGSWSGATPSNAIWKVRKTSGGATKYYPSSGPGVIASSTGMSVKVVLQEDTINTS
jgi:hypothetical protein